MFETPFREKFSSPSEKSVTTKESKLDVRFENPNYLPFPEASIDFEIVNELFEMDDDDEGVQSDDLA